MAENLVGAIKKLITVPNDNNSQINQNSITVFRNNNTIIIYGNLEDLRKFSKQSNQGKWIGFDIETNVDTIANTVSLNNNLLNNTNVTESSNLGLAANHIVYWANAEDLATNIENITLSANGYDPIILSFTFQPMPSTISTEESSMIPAAEEILSLTGSRIEDPCYKNNIVFDVEGLNELLQHIRDYPVIDIDSIGESDTDELNTDKNVWQTYTDDTPCIKIIYGDSENTNGNLSTDNIGQIRDLKEQIRLYNGVHGIANKYKTIEAEYKTLISNLEDELKKIVANVQIRQYNLLHSNSGAFECKTGSGNPVQFNDNITWEGSLYSLLVQKDKTNSGRWIQEDFYRLDDTDGRSTILDGLYYKITYEINNFYAKIEDWIDAGDNINLNNCYTIHCDPRTQEDAINQLNLDGTENSYVIMPLIPYQSNGVQINELPDISAFLSAVFTETAYNTALNKELRASFMAYNDEIIKLNSLLYNNNDELNNIKVLLIKYINYLRIARYQCYEEIRKYLLVNNISNENLNDEVTAYGTTAYNNVVTYVTSNYLQSDIDAKYKEIETIINGAVDNKYDKVEGNALSQGPQPNTDYYIIDPNTNRYTKVTIDSFENNQTYYTLAENTFPAVYGYKYVKVGSNIEFNNNKVYPFIPNPSNVRDNGTYIYPEVNPSSDQRNGHFRITINNHTYEIGIKGFDNDSNNNLNSSTNNLIAGTSIVPNVNSTGTDSGYNLGSSTSQWNTLYTRAAILGNGTGSQGAGTIRPYANNTGQLGNASYKWKSIYGVNGYFDTITPSEADSPANGTNLGTTTTPWTNAYITTVHTSNLTGGGTSGSVIIGNAGSSSSSGAAQLVPADYTDSSLGTGQVSKNGNTITEISFTHPWDTAFITNSYTDTGTFNNINIKLGNTYTDLSSYINSQVTYGPGHILSVTDTTNGVTPDDLTSTSYSANTAASINTKGGIYAEKDIWARRVFNAVFNDYAECRTTINLTPGHVVIDQDDGSLACSSKRLQPGAQVISDTYGHLMGETKNAKTPIAVAGRVLVYTYQPRENYHAGMAVCSAPDGTVDIMSRAEICEYPDCIVGIVSEIPQYEIWGSDNVKVDGRIWIKVR